MVVPLAALALLLAACGRDEDTDQLSQGRRNLHAAPCGGAPAIAGVAGVNADGHAVYVGDWVLVSVCNLQTLVKDAEAEQQPVTLYIEGIDSGLQPTGIDYDSGTMTFILERNAKNKAIWTPLLYNPLFDPNVTIRISAGIHGDKPLPRAPHANTTLVLQKIYFDWAIAIWMAGLVAIAVALIWWGHNSDMLRDGAAAGGVRQPYSLARTQMAWWLLLILIGYNYIWLVTGDRDSIAPSLLALMGISAATAIASEAISKRATAAKSAGFWHDLVTNEQGVVALDRFQIVAWTLVLGGIFLYSVIWDLTMPEFSATMLALMGISSGTYLGFKLPTKSEEPKA
jgi:hypothetical protein